ncbi:MAG: hypothetical protein KKD48_04395 [Nanoarchaeota archaeon]|nr:hypothetical protein [Nanoarchaeota archaeon]
MKSDKELEKEVRFERKEYPCDLVFCSNCNSSDMFDWVWIDNKRYCLKCGFQKVKQQATSDLQEKLNRLEDEVDYLQFNYASLDECRKVDVIKLIEELKQKIQGVGK